jgi:hypothetical protein
MLPSEQPALEAIDIRYYWGFSFQVLWALTRLHDRVPDVDSGKDALSRPDPRALIASNIKIIQSLGQLRTFTTELDNPDYAGFKSRLRDLETL